MVLKEIHKCVLLPFITLCPSYLCFPSLRVSVFQMIVRGELKGQAQQTTAQQNRVEQSFRAFNIRGLSQHLEGHIYAWAWMKWPSTGVNKSVSQYVPYKTQHKKWSSLWKIVEMNKCSNSVKTLYWCLHIILAIVYVMCIDYMHFCYPETRVGHRQQHFMLYDNKTTKRLIPE